MERRTIVSGIGSALTVSISGCLGGITETQRPGEDRPPVSEEPRDVVLKSYHDRSHVVEIRLVREDETVLDSEYDLDGSSDTDVVRVEDIVESTGIYSLSVYAVDSDHNATVEWTVTDSSNGAFVSFSDDGKLDVLLDPQM